MSYRMLQMYGHNKAPKERLGGKSRKDFQEEKRQRKEARKAAYTPPKFQEGVKIGHLEVVKRVMRRGYFGQNGVMGGLITTNKFAVKCDCGVCDGGEFEVTYKRLNRGMDRCKLAPRVVKERATYTLKADHTRPPVELEKREYGRLIVHEYMMNFGWMCECRECGDFSWVRYSRFLERYGKRPCILSCLDKRLDKAKANKANERTESKPAR